MTIRSAKPLSMCPAQYGDGTDVNTAEFTFVVENAGGSATIVEAFGFYRGRGSKSTHPGRDRPSGRCADHPAGLGPADGPGGAR